MPMGSSGTGQASPVSTFRLIGPALPEKSVWPASKRTQCCTPAEQPPAADALQPPLRCGFRTRLRRSVRQPISAPLQQAVFGYSVHTVIVSKEREKMEKTTEGRMAFQRSKINARAIRLWGGKIIMRITIMALLLSVTV